MSIVNEGAQNKSSLTWDALYKKGGPNPNVLIRVVSWNGQSKRFLLKIFLSRKMSGIHVRQQGFKKQQRE